jgi:hypothetical protein
MAIHSRSLLLTAILYLFMVSNGYWLHPGFCLPDTGSGCLTMDVGIKRSWNAVGIEKNQ